MTFKQYDRNLISTELARMSFIFFFSAKTQRERVIVESLSISRCLFLIDCFREIFESV